MVRTDQQDIAMNSIKQQFADSLLDSLGVSVLACDSDGRVVAANAGAEDLLGLSRRGIQGRKLSELFLDTSEIRPAVEEVKRGRGRITMREVALAIPEHSLMLDITISPLTDSQVEGAEIGLATGYGDMGDGAMTIMARGA